MFIIAVMEEIFKKYKEIISSELESFLSKIAEKEKTENPWFHDSIARLRDFATAGKMVRGGLVLLSEEMFSGKITNDGIICATSLELIQTGLLIHDDIMDKDTKRRGKDTIFFQYKKLAEKRKMKESYHIGESMGICVGDTAFFLSFLRLGEISKKFLLAKLISKISEELILVGTAQMEDVITSHQTKPLSESEILSLYRHKTARYSFSLPLSVGAILAEADESTIPLLEEIGEHLGIIFQIQDDTIGLIGNPQITGKPKGSDVRENKKTLYHSHLLSLANKEEKNRLNKIFGNKNLKDKDITFVVNLCEKYNVFETIENKMKHHAKLALEKIQVLPVAEKYKKYLTDLVEYNLRREK